MLKGIFAKINWPQMIITLLLGLILTAAYGDEINDWIDRNIWKLNPDLRVTLTTKYFINVTNSGSLPITLPKSFLNSTETGWVFLKLENGVISFPVNAPTSILYVRDKETDYCIISTITFEGSLAPLEIARGKVVWDFVNPNCEDCLSHDIVVYNWGNKDVEDQRIEVCAQNPITDIRINDNYYKKDEYCFELRRDKFLQMDKIAGTFTENLASPKHTFKNQVLTSDEDLGTYDFIAWNDGQFEAMKGIKITAWNRHQKNVLGKRIWHIPMIIIPNCIET